MRRHHRFFFLTGSWCLSSDVRQWLAAEMSAVEMSEIIRSSDRGAAEGFIYRSTRVKDNDAHKRSASECERGPVRRRWLERWTHSGQAARLFPVVGINGAGASGWNLPLDGGGKESGKLVRKMVSVSIFHPLCVTQLRLWGTIPLLSAGNACNFNSTQAGSWLMQ